MASGPARGPVYAFEGHRPRVAADAFIAPTAAVIGQVEIGAQSGVWFHCVLRGDTNFIRIGQRSNIQDGTIIHACTLEDRTFVGMGATVLDGAVIEAGGMLAAGALLTPGKRIGRGEIWQGSPAKLWRVMSPDDQARFGRTAPHYVELAQRYLADKA